MIDSYHKVLPKAQNINEEIQTAYKVIHLVIEYYLRKV